MFDWNANYSVGVLSIDAQHQNLFRLAGDLHRAMQAGNTKTVLSDLLERLISYTKVHFAHEERLMQSVNYPDLAAHKRQHEELTRQVVTFQEDFRAGRIALGVPLLQFLKRWLVQHIQESDKKYEPYLKSEAA